MRGSFISVLITVSLLSTAVGSEKQAAPAGPGSIGEIAQIVGSYFPRVQGVVKDVDGDRIILSLIKKDGLKPGMRLELWREGKSIIHPTTGAVIGKTEQRVGSVYVTEVGEIASKAVVNKRLMEPKQGDIARISPKRLSIAVIPVRSEHREVISELSERLSDSGRFNLLDQKKVDEYIKDKAERDSGLVREMAAAFGLDAALTVGVYPEDGRLLVTANIFYGEDGRLLTTVTATLDAKEVRPALGEIKPFFASRKEDVDDIPGIPFHARLAAASDIDGDGSQEWVLSDGHMLYVFREDLSGWREIWKEKVDEDAKVRQINLDIADINGNGMPEIFVTQVRNDALSSYVLEFKDGTYRTISEVPAILRIVDHPVHGSILIGQNLSSSGFSKVETRQYVWSGGAYVPGQEIPLPKGVAFYGFVFADLGDPGLHVVARDAHDRLMVYSGDNLVWKDDGRYPGIDMPVRTGGTRFNIKPRILALDIDGDGKDEIILSKNVKRAFLRGYKSSALYGLKWTGQGFVPEWEMKDIPGSVLDICVQKQGTEPLVRLLVKRPFGLFHGSKTFMASYKTTE